MQVREETEGVERNRQAHRERERPQQEGGRPHALPHLTPELPPDLTSCWERTKILLPTSEGAETQKHEAWGV